MRLWATCSLRHIHGYASAAPSTDATISSPTSLNLESFGTCSSRLSALTPLKKSARTRKNFRACGAQPVSQRHCIWRCICSVFASGSDTLCNTCISKGSALYLPSRNMLPRWSGRWCRGGHQPLPHDRVSALGQLQHASSPGTPGPQRAALLALAVRRRFCGSLNRRDDTGCVTAA